MSALNIGAVDALRPDLVNALPHMDRWEVRVDQVSGDKRYILHVGRNAFDYTLAECAEVTPLMAKFLENRIIYPGTSHYLGSVDSAMLERRLFLQSLRLWQKDMLVLSGDGMAEPDLMPEHRDKYFVTVKDIIPAPTGNDTWVFGSTAKLSPSLTRVHYVSKILGILRFQLKTDWMDQEFPGWQERRQLYKSLELDESELLSFVLRNNAYVEHAAGSEHIALPADLSSS